MSHQINIYETSDLPRPVNDRMVKQQLQPLPAPLQVD